MKARASERSRSLNALGQLYGEYLMQRTWQELNNLYFPLTDSRAFFCSSN